MWWYSLINRSSIKWHQKSPFKKIFFNHNHWNTKVVAIFDYLKKKINFLYKWSYTLFSCNLRGLSFAQHNYNFCRIFQLKYQNFKKILKNVLYWQTVYCVGVGIIIYLYVFNLTTRVRVRGKLRKYVQAFICLLWGIAVDLFFLLMHNMHTTYPPMHTHTCSHVCTYAWLQTHSCIHMHTYIRTHITHEYKHRRNFSTKGRLEFSYTLYC